MSSPPLPDERRSRTRSRVTLFCWLIAGALLLAFIGGPEVTRTQEARVLETAREMLGGGWRAWLVPHINGKLRLEKPPLAYWLAAAGFRMFGVSEGAGRVPFALCGWLTVGLVYHIGRRLFDRTAAFAAAAGLLGSYMFFRHARLAETDGPATLFVTATIWCLWRGTAPSSDEDVPRRGGGAFLQFHLAAVAWALALLAKHGAAVYPLIFLLLSTVTERRWRALGRFAVSGAPITLVLLGGAWFYAMGRLFGWETFRKELSDVSEGRDHKAWFIVYVHLLIEALLPWTGFAVLGVVAAVRRWGGDHRIRFLLLWATAVVLPLCFAGNKQFHYLMPAVPPLTLLVGWVVSRATQATLSAADSVAFDFVAWGTLLAGAAAAVAVPIVGAKTRGRVNFDDVMLAAALGIMALWGMAVALKRPPAATLFALCAVALTFPYAVGRWWPSLAPHGHRDVAADVRYRYGDGPYCFYGDNESLPLGFALRQVVPQYKDQAQLRAALAANPRLIVLVQEKSQGQAKSPPPPPLPKWLHEQPYVGHFEDQTVRVYRAPVE